MKTNRKKLELRREVVRPLTNQELSQIGGAGLDTVRMCSSTTRYTSCCGHTQNYDDTCAAACA